MKDFERQILDAISTARNGARETKQSLTDPIWQAKSAAASLGSVLPKGSSLPDVSSQALRDKAIVDSLAHPVNENVFDKNQQTPREHEVHSLKSTPLQRMYERPGLLHGHWDNAYISAAMPLLLLVEEIRCLPGREAAEVRPPIVRELQFFKQRLLKQNCPQDDVVHLSYLLCTYIDGIFNGLQTAESFNQSLLVEFHRDAWGGENCFEHLRVYMNAPKENRAVLEFYYLIMSLGFEGKYQMLEHGSVLLMDLRSRLHTELYSQQSTQSLALVETITGAPRPQYIKASKILIYGLAGCLCAYGISAWYLHQGSQKIRNDILTWVLPEPRKINIMETLPNPLSNILNEGWLEVRKDPRGWLLIFTSDGAFRTGEAALSEDFIKKKNIERLGKALAPWPGDMEVIGHTDNTQFRSKSGNNNLKLSAARAAVVAEKLRESMHLNESFHREITAIGRGESEPLADNSTAEGRRRNRRVDILWKIGQRDANEAMQQYIERPDTELQRPNNHQ